MRTQALVMVGIAIGLLGGGAEAGTITGQLTVHGVKDPHDTVVYLEGTAGQTFTPPAEHARIDQINKMFVPHVLPVLAGTTVDFHNTDKIAHDLFSPDKQVAPRLKFGAWVEGIRSYTFTTPGVAALLCHIHAEMSAYVVVVQTPYFAVADATGRFTIANVPHGTYTLMTWHEQIPPASTTVTVRDEAPAEVRLTLP